MPDIRDDTLQKYGISKHRFLEMVHFCLQYNEWKQKLLTANSNLKGVKISEIHTKNFKTDAVADLAIRREQWERKCRIIEDTAKEADADIYKYIIKAVTNEGITFNYLKTVMDIPCGKDMYYDRRRKFYYLLSHKI